MNKNEGPGSKSARIRDTSRETTGPLDAKGKDDALNAIWQTRPSTDQRPVSIVGWALALAGGALIWALGLYLWFGQ